ncbi:amino acid ABC transporter permease [Candidatus Pantoea persica]|uniref:amino acid ABC transporter permease n=1 Tax=Candidatus Pantoea persica TaxID=2518128 RepID=UPI00215DAABD|nr:amino acid ABC transporter permease [Candidatus Pantoea persica]MBA2815583.1 L-cystine transport system permease protein TcyB [Candidatus Pantoea persica]
MLGQLNFPALCSYWPELLAGLWVTIQLTVLATVGGVGLGILGAAQRSGKASWASRLWGLYVEIIRNTPFVVQLFFIVFALPNLGLKLTAGEAALLAMLISLGAYSTEIICAGIQVTPKGQWEAGRVLGLTRTQTFLRVVPPSLQRIYPALVSQCIIVMLGSSVVSQVSDEELTFAANLIQSRTFLLSFEVYLLLSIAMCQVLLALGRKWFGAQV